MGIDTRFVVMYGVRFVTDDVWTNEQKDELYELDSKYVRSMDIDSTEWVAGYPYLVTDSMRWDVPSGSCSIDPAEMNELSRRKNEVMSALGELDLAGELPSALIQDIDDSDWEIIAYVETS